MVQQGGQYSDWFNVFEELIVRLALNIFKVSMPFKRILYLLKVKDLRNLWFREFIKKLGDKIAVPHKNQ